MVRVAGLLVMGVAGLATVLPALAAEGVGWLYAGNVALGAAEVAAAAPGTAWR